MAEVKIHHPVAGKNATVPEENLEDAKAKGWKLGPMQVIGTAKMGGGGKPVDLTDPDNPYVTEAEEEEASVAPFGTSAFSSDSPGSPYSALALGLSGGLSAGLAPAAATATMDIAAEPGPTRTEDPGLGAPPARERSAYEEAERIKEKHPLIYHGAEMAALPVGMLGALGKKAVGEMTAKAGGQKVGRLAAGHAAGKATAAEMTARTAGDIAAQSAAVEPSDMPPGKERADEAAMRLAMSAGLGYGGGFLPGAIFPSAMGVQTKSILDEPPIAQSLQRGGGKPSIGRAYEVGPGAQELVETGARTGEAPAELATMRLEEKMVPAMRARQIASKERIGGLKKAYEETPEGMTRVAQDEMADTAWDIVKQLGYREGPEAGASLPGANSMREKFRRHLDEVVDYEVDVDPAVFGESGTKIDLPGKVIPTREAVEILGDAKVSAIFKETSDMVGENAVDYTHIRVVPRAMNAGELEVSRKFFDKAAKVMRETAKTETPEEAGYMRMTASARAGREKFPPHPEFAPATETSIVNPGKESQKQVSGHAARMRNLGEEVTGEKRLVQEAGFPGKIGEAGLSVNESKAFRNAVAQGTGTGQNVPQSRAIRQLAEESGLGKELAEVEGILADLYMSARMKEGGGARAIFGGVTPHPIATVPLRVTEKMALRATAIENAIRERPRLFAFIKSLKGVPQPAGEKGAQAASEALTPDDIQLVSDMLGGEQ